MSIQVAEVERLMAHYGWMLDGLKECRNRVEDWGFAVHVEKRLINEARLGLCRLLKEGTEVI